jgi:ABC-type multidrug transport system fused ATPase/permease subunit
MKLILDLVKSGKSLLSIQGRRALRVFVVTQLVLAGLDTAALYLISTVFAAGVNEVSIEVRTSGWTVAAIVVLFTARSVLSTLLTWRTMNSLARDEAEIGQRNFLAFVNNPVLVGRGFDLNDLYNSVDRGPGAMVNGVVFNYYSVIAELLAALAIMTTLLYLQPLTALTTSAFFVAVALCQHKTISRRSTRAGQDVVASTQAVYSTMSDVFLLNKVLSVMPSESVSSHMGSARQLLLSSRLRSSFLAILPRYFMELVLALGLAIVALTTYLTGGEVAAVRSITVFAAAGFRLLPIVNRVQSLILHAMTTAPSAKFAMLKRSDSVPDAPRAPADQANVVEFRNVTFRYPLSEWDALSEVNLTLRKGLQYAVIGPSGAGKTTLVDVALGILTPTGGELRRTADLRLGYVPQDTHIARMSLEGNVALEWNPLVIDAERFESSIMSSELVDFRESRLDADLYGALSLSGGQKQRVGLARAFYRSPGLLVLDEVTSALDVETEDLIMQSVHGLRGSSTVLIVAHRLSTVQHADQVIYIDGGRVAGVGTFIELRNTLPQLRRQIELGSLELLD